MFLSFNINLCAFTVSWISCSDDVQTDTASLLIHSLESTVTTSVIDTSFSFCTHIIRIIQSACDSLGLSASHTFSVTESFMDAAGCGTARRRVAHSSTVSLSLPVT